MAQKQRDAYLPGLYNLPLGQEHGMKHRQIIEIHCGCDRAAMPNEEFNARRCNCHIETLSGDENAHVEYINVVRRQR